MLTQKLKQYNDSQSFPLYRIYQENATVANPARLGGFWGPWSGDVVIDHSLSADIQALPQKAGPGHRRRRKAIRKTHAHDNEVLAVNTETTGKSRAVHRNIWIIVLVVFMSIIAGAARLYRWMQRRKMEREYMLIGNGRSADQYL